MATIRDVAKASGVSVGTVSNVLNARGGEVSEETRARVLEAVRKLRYRPTAGAPGQSAVRTRTIAVVMRNFSESPIIANPYFGALLDGIIGYAGVRHWATTIFVEEMWEDIHRGIRTYCDGRSDGLIVVTPPSASPIVSALKERGVPFAVVAGGRQEAAVSSVNLDNAGAIRQAVRHLVELGHRDIAFVEGTPGESDTEERLRAFLDAMDEVGLPHPIERIVAASFNEQIAYEAAGRLLHLPSLPTAVVCSNDQIAAGVIRRLSEEGLKVPRDISVVGFDDLPFATQMNPPLTTVRQPIAQIGRRAVELLLRMIEGESEPGEKIIVPSELVVRQSTAKPRKRRLALSPSKEIRKPQ